MQSEVRVQMMLAHVWPIELNELSVDQSAGISVTALSGHEFEGAAREIVMQAKSYNGNVVYEVTAELTDPDVF